MNKNALERLIVAAERIAINARPAIALQAVQHIIAIPDESARIGALVGLADSVQHEVREKVVAYLNDYLTFLDEIEEKYPIIRSEIPQDLVFKLNYFRAMQQKDYAGLAKLLDFEKCPDKNQFIRNFFAVDPKRAIDFVEKLSAEKMTFSEIYEIAELILERAQEVPTTLFDKAIAVEGTYENIIKIAKRVFNKDKNVAIKYFEQALQRRAQLEDYRSTGDFLLGEKRENLAKKFYETSLGKEKSPKKYQNLAEHCLQLGSKTLAERFINHAAEKADTFKEYAASYVLLLKDASQNESEDIIRIGLERFKTVEDYEFALGYLEKKYGLVSAGRFAAKVRNASDDVKKICNSYIHRAEETKKADEERHKKQTEDLEVQLPLRTLERAPPRREQVSVPQSHYLKFKNLEENSKDSIFIKETTITNNYKEYFKTEKL